MKNLPRKLIIITLLAAALLAGASRLAYAQDSPARTTQPSVTIESPDYSQFLPHAQEKSKVSFYERCMLSGNSILDPEDQKAMCACMSANAAQLEKNDIKMGFWASDPGKKQMTPYEMFVTRIFAPCMYLEAPVIGKNQCYSDNRYLGLFRKQENYDAYCDCYTDAVTSYMKNYAQPLLAASMAGYTSNLVFPSLLNMYNFMMGPSYYDDPVKMLLNDPDYRLYMDTKQRECLRTYSINPGAVP